MGRTRAFLTYSALEPVFWVRGPVMRLWTTRSYSVISSACSLFLPDSRNVFASTGEVRRLYSKSIRRPQNRSEHAWSR
jgi:hypothetical protein